jgi:DNA polymerase III epsilon subunit-like protein
MINYNYLCFYDLETVSASPNSTQIIQIASVMIHPRKLEIVPNSEFESLVYATDDPEECEKLGLDRIQDDALAVNKVTREQIASAPKLKSVWNDFCQYVNNYNFKKTTWTSPLMCGFNNNNFDDIILNRVAGSHGWGYGPFDEKYKKCSLFHPIHNIDLMKITWGWFEQSADPKRLNFDSLRDFFGLSSDGAHSAIVDVRQGAELLCRFLKLQRNISSKVNWKNK